MKNVTDQPFCACVDNFCVECYDINGVRSLLM